MRLIDIVQLTSNRFLNMYKLKLINKRVLLRIILLQVEEIEQI